MQSLMQHTAATHARAMSARQLKPPASGLEAKAAADFPSQLISDAWSYQQDFWQRGVLFLDILRERANKLLDHEQAGLPPLLDFPYEMILDARSFDSSANYALLYGAQPGAESCAT